MYARPARWARVRTSRQASAPQSSSGPIEPDASIGRARDTAPAGTSVECPS